jgi:hypothetical protein
LMSGFLVVVMGVTFFILCVNRFTNADFSRIKIYKHAHR